MKQAAAMDGLQERTENQFELFCHCENYEALKTRRMPGNAGIHLEPLLLWSSPEKRGSQQPALDKYAPPTIYAVHHKGRTRLLASHEEPSHSVARFTISRRLLDTDGVASEMGRYLTPDHLYVLSHLLSLIIRPNGTDAALFEHQGRYLLGFQPGFLKSRMGRDRSAHGALYDRFERIVSDLSRIRISYDRRDEKHQWQRIASEPFFDLFSAGGKLDTFDALLQPANEKAKRGRGCRYRETYWKVRIGRPMDALLRYADTSNIVAVLPNFCELAKRSPVSKWLLLYYAGHGHDGQEIRPRRIDTLCRAMCPDYDATIKSSMSAKDKSVGAARWFDHALAAEKRRTVFIRRIAQGLTHLHGSGFFESVSIKSSNSVTDRRLKSRSYQPSDLVTVTRHASLIEQNIDKFGVQRSTAFFRTLKQCLKGYSARLRSGAKANERHQRIQQNIKQLLEYSSSYWGAALRSALLRLTLSLATPQAGLRFHTFKQIDPPPLLIS